jgi:hypothetical protein
MQRAIDSALGRARYVQSDAPAGVIELKTVCKHSAEFRTMAFETLAGNESTSTLRLAPAEGSVVSCPLLRRSQEAKISRNVS